MAEDIEKKVLLSVELKATEALKNLAELKIRSDELKKSQKELDTSTKEGRVEYERLGQGIKALNSRANEYQKEIQNDIKYQEEQEGSLKSLRAQLYNTTKEFDNLSRSEREGAKGKELLNKITGLQTELTDAEQASGRFQRNVGNYPTVVTSVIPGFDKLSGILGTIGFNISDLATKGGAGFAALGKSAVSLGKSFLTPPIGLIVAVLSAIMLAIQKVSAAFKKNDEASTRLSQSFAVLQPIITLIGKGFDILANSISKVIEVIANSFSLVTEFAETLGLLPKGFTDAAKASQELVTATDNLEQTERDYTVNSAKRNAETAKLRDMALDKEKYTADERMSLLEKAINNEKQNLEDEKNIAAESLRILEAKAKQENDTSDDTSNKIAAARAEMYNAEENYYTGTRRLQSQFLTAQKEMNKEAEDAEKERQQRMKEAADRFREQKSKELEAIRAAQDAALELIKDNQQHELEILKTNSQRQVEDLQKRLDTEKNLTKAAREAITAQILSIQEKSKNDEAEINKKYSDEEIARLAADEQAKIELRLLKVKAGTDEEFAARRAQLELQMQQELADTELTENQKALIRAKYQRDIDANAETQAAAVRERQAQALTNDFNEQLLKLGENEAAKAQLKLDFAIKERENLLAMDAETKAQLYESNEAYEAARIESAGRIIEAEKAVQQTSLQSAQNQLAAMASISGALNDVFSTIAGDNESMQGFLKVLALSNIAMNTAKGIAGAVSAGAGLVFPANLGAIAAGVDAVLLGIASAYQALSKSKEVKSPKFSQGGMLKGASHAHGGIPIEAEGGEAIINKRSTAMFKPLLSVINEAGGGVKFAAGGIAGLHIPSLLNVDTRFINDGGYAARHNETKQITLKEMQTAMTEAVSQVRVYSTVEDIRRADRNYSRIESVTQV